MRWKDKKDVVMLSTMYEKVELAPAKIRHKLGEGTETIFKPTIVSDYNTDMGDTDRYDQSYFIPSSNATIHKSV